MAEPTTHTEVPQGHGTFAPFDPQTFPSQLFWLTLGFRSALRAYGKGGIAADRHDH
jgi:hypothetical protein